MSVEVRFRAYARAKYGDAYEQIAGVRDLLALAQLVDGALPAPKVVTLDPAMARRGHPPHGAA